MVAISNIRRAAVIWDVAIPRVAVAAHASTDHEDAAHFYNIDLQSKSETAGMVHAEGKAGTRDDKSVDFKISFDRIPVSDCVPSGWRENVKGAATGKIFWKGQNPKLETSSGEASLRVTDGEIAKVAFLEKIAALTGEEALEHLELNECKLDLEWRYPNAEVKNLLVEDKGKIRAEGRVTIREKMLGGAIELGVARGLLDWLPDAEEVFSREHDGYLWTTVHLSGTLDSPQQDLSPRMVDALEESPAAALGMLFRGLGEWLRNAFGGD